MEVAEPDPAAGLGARLRRAREQRSLSIEECAERLYLPASVIEALESEQYATLGGGVYARGHLRRYAGLLELDTAGLEQLMVQRLSGAPDLATIQTHRIGHSTQSRRLGLVPVAIVAALLALSVLVWWSVRHGADRAPATPVPVPVAPSDGAPQSGGSPGATTAPDLSGAGSTPATLPAAAEPTGTTSAKPSSAPAPASVAVPAPAAAPVSAPPSAATPSVATRRTLVIASAGPVASAAPASSASPAVVASLGPEAAAPASSAALPRRRAAPVQKPAPAVPAGPRETQRDYMNFEF
jgi:cytoskeleton protein RodZ